MACNADQLADALVQGWYSVVISDTDIAPHHEMELWTADRIILCSGKRPEEIERDFPGRPYILKPFDEAELIRG